VTPSKPKRIRRFLRLGVAAFFIAILLFEGVINAAELASRGFLNDAFLVLASTLGSALVYSLAYFWYLKDVVGGSLQPGARSLWDRWSSFARAAALVCVILMWLNEIGDIRELHHLLWTITFLTVSTVLIPAWVAATEEYFWKTAGAEHSEKAAVERCSVVCWTGTLLTRHIRGAIAMVLGSALVLVSLFLPMELMGSWGQLDRTGREILFGVDLEVTAKMYLYDFLEYSAMQIGRGIYAAALIIASIALVAALLGKSGKRILQSRALLIAVGAVAMFVIINFTMSWALFAAFWGFPYPIQLTLFVWCALWLLPVALWIWRSRDRGLKWEHTRVAICILQLPIVFFYLGTLPFERISRGYLFFLFGLQFLWWGHLTI